MAGSRRDRADSIALRYTATVRGGQPEEVRYTVPLTWTPCNGGGERPWFLCPGVTDGRLCGRRVALLYAAGTYFACRHCYELVYESQRERRSLRLLHKAQAMRIRLGGDGLDGPFPPKPKGMHWRTYERQCAEIEAAEWASEQALGQWLGLWE